MPDLKPRPRWPGMRTEPHEFERYAAAPEPNEDELETVFFDSTNQGGFLSTAVPELAGVWPEERSLDLSGSRIEGWVAGLPVVDGVADSGWEPCEGGRVRVVIRVGDFPAQREWVRAMSHGGAYAREVLGQVA